MAEALPYAALAALVVLVWAGVLIMLDIFTPDDVRAWRRLSVMRGYATPRSPIEKAAVRVPALRRLLDELDLERLLAIAVREQRPLAFLGRAVAQALAVFAVVLGGDALARGATGDWPLPPWFAGLLALAMLPLSVVELRRAASRAQEACTKTLGDMMMMVAAITDSRGFQLGDAVRILSRCARDDALQQLVDAGGWKRLVHERPRSTLELYRLIGDRYRLSLFTGLADVITTTDVGFPERDAFTRLAISVYQERLADARLRSARAKVLVTLPVAGMLVPLLLLIGAPTFAVILHGFQGG
jgi:hypothetical protein